MKRVGQLVVALTVFLVTTIYHSLRFGFTRVRPEATFLLMFFECLAFAAMGVLLPAIAIRGTWTEDGTRERYDSTGPLVACACALAAAIVLVDGMITLMEKQIVPRDAIRIFVAVIASSLALTPMFLWKQDRKPMIVISCLLLGAGMMLFAWLGT